MRRHHPGITAFRPIMATPAASASDRHRQFDARQQRHFRSRPATPRRLQQRGIEIDNGAIFSRRTASAPELWHRQRRLQQHRHRHRNAGDINRRVSLATASTRQRSGTTARGITIDNSGGIDIRQFRHATLGIATATAPASISTIRRYPSAMSAFAHWRYGSNSGIVIDNAGDIAATYGSVLFVHTVARLATQQQWHRHRQCGRP